MAVAHDVAAEATPLLWEDMEVDEAAREPNEEEALKLFVFKTALAALRLKPTNVLVEAAAVLDSKEKRQAATAAAAAAPPPTPVAELTGGELAERAAARALAAVYGRAPDGEPPAKLPPRPEAAPAVVTDADEAEAAVRREATAKLAAAVKRYPKQVAGRSLESLPIDALRVLGILIRIPAASKRVGKDALVPAFFAAKFEACPPQRNRRPTAPPVIAGPTPRPARAAAAPVPAPTAAAPTPRAAALPAKSANVAVKDAKQPAKAEKRTRAAAAAPAPDPRVAAVASFAPRGMAGFHGVPAGGVTFVGAAGPKSGFVLPPAAPQPTTVTPAQLQRAVLNALAAECGDVDFVLDKLHARAAVTPAFGAVTLADAQAALDALVAAESLVEESGVYFPF